jgi:hypothetical protein
MYKKVHLLSTFLKIFMHSLYDGLLQLKHGHGAYLCYHLRVFQKLLVEWNVVNRGQVFIPLSLHVYVSGEVQFAAVKTTRKFNVQMLPKMPGSDRGH